MYKVLVVEDEDFIRKGLVYSIAWEELDCVVVGEGRNGLEGVELIQKHQPDIVLTDINMPILGGLEMISQTIEHYDYFPIILSGYSTFEFAQTALHYGAVDYLLKPLDRNELTLAVTEAQDRCERQKAWKKQKQSHNSRNIYDLDVLNLNYTDPIVLEMLDYIKQNYGEKITLQDIVTKLNYSISFLNKKFKQETGTTFIDYLNRYRLQKSIEFLEKGEYSLQEIAWKCGFADYKYFSNTFKRQLGHSPKTYLNLVQEESKKDLSSSSSIN